MMFVQNGFVKMDHISISHENLAINGPSKVRKLHTLVVLNFAGQRGGFSNVVLGFPNFGLWVLGLGEMFKGDFHTHEPTLTLYWCIATFEKVI